MFNKNKITISISAFALAMLGACSDDKSVAGATVDPDVLAQNDSIPSTGTSSSNSTTVEPSIQFSSKPTSTIDVENGSVSIYDDENGASGECIADGKKYAAKIQTRSSDKLEVLTSLEIEEHPDECDNLYKEFKYECDSKSGNFTEINKNCEDGSFSILCKYKGDDSETFKSVFDGFSEQVSKACSELTEGAENSFGKFETPSSTSKEGDVVPTSGSSTDPVDIPPEDIDKYTQYPTDMGEGGVDVPSTGIVVKTLNNYTAQFTDDPAELSFDSHVLAYNGSIPGTCNVLNEENSVTMDNRIYTIGVDEIGDCFPTTAEAAKTADYKFNESCNYYIATSSDGGQPTGHTITKVVKDTIEFTSVHTGGRCMLSQRFFSVMYLIEDCDSLISKSTKTTSKSFTSTIWTCEEGSYSPTKEASAYGEWFRDDLSK